MGRFEEALAARERLKVLDPLAPTTGLVGPLRNLGRYDLAKAAFREVVELHPNFWQGHEGLGQTLEATGELEEAVRAFERAVAVAGRTARPRAGLARVLALSGREAEARRIIEELRTEAAASGNYHPMVAVALVAVGEADAAIDWLETAYRQRHPGLVEVDADLRFAELRPDPRFQELMRRIGFRR